MIANLKLFAKWKDVMLCAQLMVACEVYAQNFYHFQRMDALDRSDHNLNIIRASENGLFILSGSKTVSDNAWTIAVWKLLSGNNGAQFLKIITDTHSYNLGYYGSSFYDDDSRSILCAGVSHTTGRPTIAEINVSNELLCQVHHIDKPFLYSYSQGKKVYSNRYVFVGKALVEEGKPDYWLVKTDSLLNPIFEQTYGTSEYDLATTVSIAQDGGYYLGGESRGYGDYIGFYTDALLIKTDSMGNEQWRTTWGGYYNDAIWNVETTADGGVVACGCLSVEMDEGLKDQCDGYIRKMDENGNLVWEKRFEYQRPRNGGYPISFNMCRVLDNGSIVAVGLGYKLNSDSIGSRYVPWSVLLNSKGKVLMNRAYTSLVGSHSSAQFQDIQPTADGGFLAGGTYHPGQNDTGNQDAFIVKLDERGCEYPDCMPPLAVEEPEDEEGKGFTAYPNPFDGSITFMTGGAEGVIVIYDIRGVAIDRITVRDKESTVQYSGERLTPGVYIASYVSERDTRQTIRIVKQ